MEAGILNQAKTSLKPLVQKFTTLDTLKFLWKRIFIFAHFSTEYLIQSRDSDKHLRTFFDFFIKVRNRSLRNRWLDSLQSHLITCSHNFGNLYTLLSQLYFQRCRSLKYFKYLNSKTETCQTIITAITNIWFSLFSFLL